MRRAALISAGLHLAVLAAALLGLPHLFRPDLPTEATMAVELVSVEAATAPPKPVPPSPPPEPPAAKAPPPPKPEPPAAKPEPPAPPPPPQIAALPPPELKPEPKPEPPKPEPKPPPPEAKPAPPPPAATAPQPKRKPKPPPDAFDALLKNLAKEAQTRKPAPKPPEVAAKAPPIARTAPSPAASSEQNRVAAQLGDLVRQQVVPCWNIPAGARDAVNLRIGVRIALNPDGTLRGAPQIEDQSRLRADEFYRVAAESAVRALQNPRCSPLKLPVAHYDMWREITFNFDPREALGP